MLEAIVNGIGLGLLMSVLVGPVFFALISIALHYGKRAALWFAIGTSLSDLVYATIVFLTVGAFRLSHAARWWMGVCGGIVFAIMGIIMIVRTLKHAKEAKTDIEIEKKHNPLNFLSQGFITNALNPSVILFRATAVSSSIGTLSRKADIPVLIITTLIVFICTDLLKIHLAEKLKKILNRRVLYRLHLTTGVILIVLGIAVIIKTLLSHHI